MAIVEEPPGAVACVGCGHCYDPRQGVAGRGKFTCGACGVTEKILDAVRRTGAALPAKPHALEGYCEACGRFFKKLDDADQKVLKRAAREFERRKGELRFPREAIPVEGRSDPRPVNHGYTHFHQMFNSRQLLCLSLLLEEILKLPEERVRELMLVAFSDCLDANTMFCKYEVAWHKISKFFGFHAYHPIERPTENNVWGTRFGRGTFRKCFQKVLRAKRPAIPEGAPAAGNGAWSKRAGPPRGVGVADFAALKRTERGALLRCQSAEKLDFLPDGAVDAVITDPPYFDNVQYGELADFFHVWLRLALGKRYPWFAPEYGGRSRELVKNDKGGKDGAFFNTGLGKVFAECRRVLKDDGLLIFTFHHGRTWAWAGLARLLVEAGFYVSASPVVRSEGKSGYHSSAGNIKYDCVLVCRKAPAARRKRLGSVAEEAVVAAAAEWAGRTLASGMAVGEADAFAMVMGQALVLLTQSANKGNGSGGAGWDALLARIGERAGEVLARGQKVVEAGTQPGNELQQ